MPFVSVIVPVFNAQNYIEKCLNSIKNQTYRDFEVLMVDDGSEDGSAEICKKFCGIDERFKYFYQDNSGPDMSRKAGTEIASGQYIMFVDSDDYISDQMLEHLIDAANEYNADVICGQIVRVSGEKKWDATAHSNSVKIYEDKKAAMEAYFCDGFLVGSYVAKLINTKLMKKYSFVQNSIIGEDISGILFLIENSKKIVVIPEVDYFYSWNGTSISHSGYTPRHKESLKNYIKVRDSALSMEYLPKSTVCGYFAGFQMATATAMSRNWTFDEEAIDLLRLDLKKNWKNINGSKKLARYMKICILIYIISPKLFFFLYRIVYLFTGR